MPSIPVSERVRRYRQALRKAGLRPVQLWVPDSRRADFAAQCARQARAAARQSGSDAELGRWMDDAAADVQGWTD